jgi:hypothetical protein
MKGTKCPFPDCGVVTDHPGRHIKMLHKGFNYQGKRGPKSTKTAETLRQQERDRMHRKRETKKKLKENKQTRDNEKLQPFSILVTGNSNSEFRFGEDDDQKVENDR